MQHKIKMQWFPCKIAREMDCIVVDDKQTTIPFPAEYRVVAYARDGLPRYIFRAYNVVWYYILLLYYEQDIMLRYLHLIKMNFENEEQYQLDIDLFEDSQRKEYFQESTIKLSTRTPLNLIKLLSASMLKERVI